MRSTQQLVLSLLLSMVASPVMAFDLGDPTFQPLDGPRNRFEIIYASMERDVWLGLDRPRIGNPTTGPVAIATQEPPRRLGKEGGDIFLGRWAHQPFDFISTQFDIGFADDSGNDEVELETQIVVGGAVKMLLTESGPFQLVSHFDAHFTPDFRTYQTGTSALRGSYVAHGTYDSYQYGAALLASMTTTTEDGIVVSVYGGPRLSAFRGEVRSYADFENGERIWLDGIVKQASPFGVVVGARFQWNETWSARVEGRFIEEQSVSAGLSASF